MRLLPLLTPENAPFWTGGAQGKLLITCCSDCSAAIHPPALICPTCLSRNVVPRAAGGTGMIYSYTINHQPWLPDMVVPFALAIVDVDGMPGVRITCEVIDAPLDEVKIGSRVSFTFLPVEDVWVPQVRLSGAA
ncbi:hypothetical protein GGQ88_002202 [Novosphingobium hassiacum]|uniref:DNA-binding protein n=1 Tax=Novosphingobium hassiacum TaxID=173676 RepID=A0A7W5ZVX8_9SPHN|nr:OB-fold domain-containing protein [Novosphingobium hassiacum]MBB3860933.1 hypothetical protein [Novosphingobium hassiacum]